MALFSHFKEFRGCLSVGSFMYFRPRAGILAQNDVAPISGTTLTS